MKIENLKLKISVVVTVFMAVYFFAGAVKAQSTVNYNNEVIVDSDLDGLTDKGEKQLYQTDPSDQDTDRDGYLDGAEVLAGTDPLNARDYPGHRLEELIARESAVAGATTNTPWAWYVARSSGLLAFIFLWLTVFLGLSIRNPLLKKIVEPLYSFEFHCFLGSLAVFWSLLHGTSFLFDKALGFGLKDIAIPYFSETTLVNPNYLALGIMAFYAMVIMTVSSYLRSRMNPKLWRILHFLNPVAFIFVVFHGYYNGTEMQDIRVATLYLFASLFLVVLYLSTLGSVILQKIKEKKVESIQ